MMRVVLLAIAAIGVACADSGPNEDPGRVRGTIVTVGGPAPGAPSPVAGASFRLVPVGTSTAGAGGRTGPRGQFTVDVAGGTYTVVMTAHTPVVDGRPLPPTPRRITVVSGRTTRVRLVISIA